MVDARRRGWQPKLISRVFLIALGLAAGGLLGWLLPDRSAMRGRLETYESVDKLSLIYLELAVHEHPDEARSRLLLAQRYYQLGRHDDAERTLGPLLERAAPERREAGLLAIEVQHARCAAIPREDSERSRARSRDCASAVATRIRDWLAREPVPSRAALERLAALALASQAPVLAGDLYSRLADRGGDARQRAAWRDQANTAYALAADSAIAALVGPEHELAGQAAAAPASSSWPGTWPGTWTADQPGAALARVHRELDRAPGERPLIDAALALALADGRPHRAAALGRRLLALRPDDPSLIARQLDAELAVGDIERAMPLARRLVAMHPESLRARERLAELATWAGQPLAALAQWAWLARHGGDERHLARAIELARALWDLPLALELTLLAARKQGLSRDQLLDVAALQVRLGEPEQARALIERQLARRVARQSARQDHRPSWNALLAVQLALVDLEAAARTWAQIHQRFGAREPELRARAELLWRARQPEQALAVLAHGNVPLEEPESVRLMAELAWHTEDHARALAAYETLWRRDQARPDEATRLAILARHQGRTDLAVAVAVDTWQRKDQPEALVLAMRLAADASRWDELARIAALAERAPGPRPRPFEAQPEYWRLRLYLAEQRVQAARARGDVGAADRAVAALERELARAVAHAGDFAGHPDHARLRADLGRHRAIIALRRQGSGVVTRASARGGADRPADMPAPERVHALALRDREAAAMALATRELQASRAPEQRARLAVQAEELAARVPREVDGRVRMLELGRVRLYEAGAGFRHTWDHVGMGARVHARRLDDDAPRATTEPGPAPVHEAEILAQAEWRTRNRSTTVGLGGHFRGRKALPQATLASQHALGHGLHAGLSIGMNQTTEESGALRLLAVRDHAAVQAGLDLGERWFTSARLGGQILRNLQRNRLGTGLDVEAALGYRLARDVHDWNLRAVGAASPRFREPQASSLVSTGGASLALATTLTSRWPSSATTPAPVPSGRLFYLAELALGWALPSANLFYSGALGIGAPILGSDKLSLTVKLTSEHGAVPAEQWRGIMLTYARSLWL